MRQLEYSNRPKETSDNKFLTTQHYVCPSCGCGTHHEHTVSIGNVSAWKCVVCGTVDVRFENNAHPVSLTFIPH